MPRSPSLKTDPHNRDLDHLEQAHCGPDDGHDDGARNRSAPKRAPTWHGCPGKLALK